MATTRVHLIAMGGTISMVSSESGLVPGLNAEDFLDQCRSAQVTITSQSLPAVPGASITAASLSGAIDAARAAVTSGASGIVITQGTDTLEETSFLADLVWEHDQPLVLTGAMRPASAQGSDGLGNLSAAIRVAADPHAPGRGALVVFGDEVFAPRHLQKVHSSKLNAFASPGAGPVGILGENAIHWWSAPEVNRPTRFSSLASPSRVTTVIAQLDSSPEVLRWAAESSEVGAAIIAAMGVGHVPEWWVEPLAKLVSTKTVVYCSRTGTGPAYATTYGFPGSEKDLSERGLLSSGSLNLHKARLLLAQCQEATSDKDDCERLFTHWVAYYSGLGQTT